MTPIPKLLLRRSADGKADFSCAVGPITGCERRESEMGSFHIAGTRISWALMMNEALPWEHGVLSHVAAI
jgi:hypothetical protein